MKNIFGHELFLSIFSVKHEIVVGDAVRSPQDVHDRFVDDGANILAEREIIVTPFGFPNQVVLKEWH